MDAAKTVISGSDAPQQDGGTSVLPDHVAVQPSKLDADNYNADDLDGVMDSVLGTGNLNYLLLQARQTDAAMAANGFDNLDDDGANGSGLGGVSALMASGSRAGELDGAQARGDATMAPPADGTAASGGQDYFSGGRLAAFSGTMASGGVAGGVDGRDGVPPSAPRNGLDGGGGGGDGTMGRDGARGADGADNPGTTLIENVTNTINNAIDDTTSIVNNAIDNTTTLIENVTDVVNNTVNNLTDIKNITEIISDILNPPEGDIDLFQHNDLGLPQIDANLDAIEAIIGDIDIGLGVVHDGESAGLSLGAIAAGTPLVEQTEIPVPLPPAIAGAVDQALDALPDTNALLTDPQGTIEGILADPMSSVEGLQGMVEGLAGGLLNPAPGAPGDTDLIGTNNIGLPPLDVNLDAVEGLLGDIDINADLGRTGDGLNLGLDALALGGTLVDTNIPVNTAEAEALLQNPAAALENIAADPAGAIDGITGSLQPTIDAALGEISGELPGGLPDILPGVLPDVLPGGLPGLNEFLADPSGAIEDIAGSILNPAPQPGGDVDLALTGNLGLPPVVADLGAIEDIAGDMDLALDIANGPEGLVAGLDTVVGGSELTDAAIPIGLGGLPAAGDLLADPSAALQDLAGGLLNPAPGGEGDTDLVETNSFGLPPLDANIDAVEGVLGDIDLGLDLSETPETMNVGLDALALGSDIAHTTVPLGLGEFTDGTIDETLDDMGNTVIAETAGIVEQVTGAGDLLSLDTVAATGGITDLPGGGETFAWPQVEGSGVSSAIADTIGGLVGNMEVVSGVLSSPSGSVSEGLGLLDLGNDHQGGGLVSLFGGHHGGLFG